MSEMAEQRAEHSELKAAATKIMSSQSAEVSELKGWLSAWYDVRQE